MNPYNEGFMVRPENSKNKNVVFACRPCLLDIHNRRESGSAGLKYPQDKRTECELKE